MKITFALVMSESQPSFDHRYVSRNLKRLIVNRGKNAWE